jgi:predicted transcriptional regulator
MESMETPLDFDAARMLAMYADGKSVEEIAAACFVSPGKVREKINEHPHEKEEAKRSRSELRNAKYRRVGALAVDIQLEVLQSIHRAISSPETPEAEKLLLRDKLKDISAIGETAERRADLNEGKPTERTDVKGGGFQVVLSSSVPNISSDIKPNVAASEEGAI